MYPHNSINCPYENYYIHQAGSGIGVIYKGVPYQRGHGIGNFLGGLFRSVLPLLSNGAKAIGKEALSAGVGLLSDMTRARPMDESIKSRLKEISSNLKRRADQKIDKLNMTGTGYITKRKCPGTVISSSNGKERGGRKRKSTHQYQGDIFT